MMRTRLISSLCFVFLASLVFFACTFNEKTNEIEWKPKFKLPLARATFTIEELGGVRNVTFKEQVPLQDIRPNFLPNTTIPVLPPFTVSTPIGPYLLEFSEFIWRASADSINLTLSVENKYPITIGAGTKVVLRQTTDLSSERNVIYRFILQESVPPNGLLVIPVVAANIVITGDVYMYLEDFNSPGGTNITFTETTTTFYYDIRIILVDRVSIKTNKQLRQKDTLDIDVQQNDDRINEQDASGTITLFIENQLPVHTTFQFYMLDANKVLIDSMLPGKQRIEGGETNSLGQPIRTTESRVQVNVSRERYQNFLRSKYIYGDFESNTFGYPGDSVVGNKDVRFSMQIVTDLNLNIKLKNL